MGHPIKTPLNGSESIQLINEVGGNKQITTQDIADLATGPTIVEDLENNESIVIERARIQTGVFNLADGGTLLFPYAFKTGGTISFFGTSETAGAIVSVNAMTTNGTILDHKLHDGTPVTGQISWLAIGLE
jgi:hypothetical protein